MVKNKKHSKNDLILDVSVSSKLNTLETLEALEHMLLIIDCIKFD